MSILYLVMLALCVYVLRLLSSFFGTSSGFFGLATLQYCSLYRNCRE